MGRLRRERGWLLAVAWMLVLFNLFGLHADHHARSAPATSSGASAGDQVWELDGGAWVSWDLEHAEAGRPVEPVVNGKRGSYPRLMVVSVAHWMEWAMWGGSPGLGNFVAEVRRNGDLLLRAASTEVNGASRNESGGERRAANIPAGGPRRALLHHGYEFPFYRGPIVLVGATNVQSWIEESGFIRYEETF